ncbi:MAG: hypothetical protein ACI31M_00040 [Bacilli bacterium]
MESFISDLIKSKDYSKKINDLMSRPNTKSECENLLNDEIFFILNDNILLMNFLCECDWAKDYLKDNFDRFVCNDYYTSTVYTITKWAVRFGAQDILDMLAYHMNLNVRAEFMKTIFLEYRSLIEKFYKDDICSYFVNKDSSGVVEKMQEKDLSMIAYSLFDYCFNDKLYTDIKEFIFENYETNHLSQYIMDLLAENDFEPDIFHCYEELMKDINRYFKTADNYKYELIKRFGDNITTPEKDEYLFVYNYVFYEMKCDIEGKIMVLNLLLCNLRDRYLQLVNKYYKQSQSKNIIFKGAGSTSFSIQIDDKILKFSNMKYISKYNVPEVFLIIKNYEYYEIRDIEGIKETIEVQQCLTKPFVEHDDEMEIYFRTELYNMGYILEDYLYRNGKANCFYLDDYHDANCSNPEDLPEWFKERPLVLVDRDLVIPIEARKEYEANIKLRKSLI